MKDRFLIQRENESWDEWADRIAHRSALRATVALMKRDGMTEEFIQNWLRRRHGKKVGEI